MKLCTNQDIIVNKQVQGKDKHKRGSFFHHINRATRQKSGVQPKKILFKCTAKTSFLWQEKIDLAKKQEKPLYLSECLVTNTY